MKVQKNIIQKSVLNLQFTGRVDGLALNKEISEWYTEVMIPQLEKALEPYSSVDAIIKIDELHFSVAVEKKENWQYEWTQQILHQVQQELHQKINGTPAKTVLQQSVSQNFLDQFFFFLQKGYLPWWSTLRHKMEWVERVEKWLEETTSVFPERWQPLLEREEVQIRLIQLLPPALLEKLVQKMMPAQAAFIAGVFHDIDSLTRTLSTPDQLRIYQFGRQALLKNIFAPDFTPTVLQSIAAALMHSPKFEVKKINSFSFRIPDFQKALLQVTAVPLQQKENEKVGESKPIPKSLIEEGEELYIDHSGLVIMAPFLPSFFNRLHLYENEKITDTSTALLLLNFLSTGREEPAEFELVLPKILCGLEVSDPVELNKMLSHEQKMEADELLRSAIEHWNILKDTSVAGFREAFLQRAGKLSFRNGEWLLQVEQKAYDLLLQQLPWNISFMKLPWMKYLLRTEWRG